ncbi:MAG: anthrone oxygenase family protein [Pseudomonadota bacterium]
MPLWLVLLSQFSILAYAALGGVFLAFSDFLMRALRLTSGAGGAEAMQAINREVFRYVFMTLFIGMVPVSLILAVGGILTAADPIPFVVAAALYVIGVFGFTAARNVPMNNALAKLDAASPDGQSYWTGTYLPKWTFWNSVRTVACLAAAIALLYGIAPSP